jgi:hypothetical protein
MLLAARSQRRPTLERMSDDPISASHGFLVVSPAGPAGVVETPIFPPDCSRPDFLIVRAGGRARTHFPVVPVARVVEIDPRRQIVRIDVPRADLRRLPERLPLVG